MMKDRDFQDDLTEPAPGERVVSAQDIMAILRETQKSGFAFRNLIETPESSEFQSANMFVASDVPADAPQVNSVSSEDALAQLVAERSFDATDPLPDLAHDDAPTATEPPESDPEPEAKVPDMDETPQQAYDRGQTAGFSDGYAQGHDQGYSVGYAAAKDAFQNAHFTVAETEKLAQMDAVLEQLQTLVASLDHAVQTETNALADAVENTVLELVNDRVGTAIAEHPESFLAKIEAMAERIETQTRDCSVVLNADDLAAITPYLDRSEYLSHATLRGDAALSHGDVQIRAGAIKLRDSLKDTQ